MGSENKLKTSLAEEEKEKPSKSAQKRKTGLKKDTMTIKCTMHGNIPLSVKNNNFYRANKASIFGDFGWIPICRNCLNEMFRSYYNQHEKDSLKALFYVCRRIDVMFNVPNAVSAIEKANRSPSATLDSIIGFYMGAINGFQKGEHCFDNSDELREDNDINSLLREIAEKNKFDSDDKRNIRDVKKKMGFDPFDGGGFQEHQLSKMYQELIGYLEDDDLVNDSFKMNVILQLINNNQQIRHFDTCTSLLNNSSGDTEKNVGLIATYIKQKIELQKSNNQIVDKNKWITTDTTGKSKLSGKMKRYRDYGFDEVDADYVAILNSPVIKTVLDASHQSIMDTLNFGDDEAKNVIRIQSEDNNSLREENMKLFSEKKEMAIEMRDLKKEIESKKKG